MGNTKSVFNAFQLLGETVKISDDPGFFEEAEAIILPGVGSFADGMENLRKKNLIEVLEKVVLKNKKPYLGICLGLQFLAKNSHEEGIHEGFGWVNGEVIKIKSNDPIIKVPHMGWNDTKILKKNGLFKDMIDPAFYYLHSYYLKVDESEKDTITSVCNYGESLISSTVQKDNIYAVQFHPEKSQSTGLKLLQNFLEDIRK